MAADYHHAASYHIMANVPGIKVNGVAIKSEDKMHTEDSESHSQRFVGDDIPEGERSSPFPNIQHAYGSQRTNRC